MRRFSAVLAAAAALLAAPAAHAAERTDDFAKPVLFVPGPEAPSCGQFDTMSERFTEFTTSVKGVKIGFEGTQATIGLYAGAGDCTATLGAPRDAALEDLGARLAAYVKDNYANQPVDIVGFGGGGLIVRSALTQQPKLKVEDVVALGTPNAGSDALAAACAACAEMKPGSAFLRSLSASPAGDWSAIGSEADTAVPAASAIAMDAEHKTVYVLGSIGHDDLLKDSSDREDAHIRYSHAGAKWTQWNNAPHPVDRVAEDLVFGAGSSAGACGLAATRPDLCGQTPVILVPGFGASELVCDTPVGQVDTWPGALLAQGRFLDMALNNDGTGGARSTPCSQSVHPTGNVLHDVLGTDIHASSWAWVQRIAPGRAYQFGWDFRKGPDQSLARLDKLIDEVRARHGVQRVAIVCHSYGGLLTRWYVDDPKRAKKVARVANFGSPYWGAPKAWFAMAYGYETPLASPMDIVDKTAFRLFAHNLAGLYYLFPPQAWFDHVPGALKSWLEVNEVGVKDTADAANAVRAFGGNGALATTVARNLAEHIDGFTTANGVDWRIFVGSGLPTLGHVRAYTDQSNHPQYSWVNGDGTVPLVSQRQSITAGGDQFGDRVKTYNFCGIGHMEEMEHREVQDSVAPFVADGKDPLIGIPGGLQSFDCGLSNAQFTVTGKEDEKSIRISKEANANITSAHASAAPLDLDEAERAGLIDAIREPGRTVFVTTTRQALSVHVAGTGTLEVTPLTGDGTTGTPRVYDVTPAGIAVTATGARTATAAPAHAADTTPPRTTARLRNGRLTVRASDRSGIAVTLVQVGRHTPRVYRRPLRMARHTHLLVWSVDKAGNVERKRPVR